MPAASSTHRALVPGCVQGARLFQDPLLEEPPTTNADPETRRRSVSLERAAEDVCRSCPLLASCLYDAVVEHDVAGFVAATTARQRAQMRRRLGVRVEPEDFDTLAGATRQHRQVNHDEVLRLHRANPDETYEQLAARLGCSLSTVKRHLRRERQGVSRRPAVRVRPTQAQVLDVFYEVSPGWLSESAA